MRIVSPHSAGWLAAALLPLLPLSSCRDKDPHYPIVEAEQVKTANIEIYGEYAGQIKAFKSVEIHARVEGYLENMTFEEGKRVAAGEPLFYIDNAQYKAQVERARAQLSKDLAQEDKARRDVERLRPLYEQNATSRLELDNAEAAYNMAERIRLRMRRISLADASVSETGEAPSPLSVSIGISTSTKHWAEKDILTLVREADRCPGGRLPLPVRLLLRLPLRSPPAREPRCPLRPRQPLPESARCLVRRQKGHPI